MHAHKGHLTNRQIPKCLYYMKKIAFGPNTTRRIRQA